MYSWAAIRCIKVRHSGADDCPSAATSVRRPYTCSMKSDFESWIAPDQQPIQRVVGRRVTPPPGTLPSAAARSAMTANAQYRTRAPKGVFFYASHDEMTRDRERWTIEAIVAKQLERG
jgi:hypothetical protein